jgi:hypothetical protein
MMTRAGFTRLLYPAGRLHASRRGRNLADANSEGRALFVGGVPARRAANFKRTP